MLSRLRLRVSVFEFFNDAALKLLVSWGHELSCLGAVSHLQLTRNLSGTMLSRLRFLRLFSDGAWVSSLRFENPFTRLKAGSLKRLQAASRISSSTKITDSNVSVLVTHCRLAAYKQITKFD